MGDTRDFWTQNYNKRVHVGYSRLGSADGGIKGESTLVMVMDVRSGSLGYPCVPKLGSFLSSIKCGYKTSVSDNILFSLRDNSLSGNDCIFFSDRSERAADNEVMTNVPGGEWGKRLSRIEVLFWSLTLNFLRGCLKF